MLATTAWRVAPIGNNSRVPLGDGAQRAKLIRSARVNVLEDTFALQRPQMQLKIDAHKGAFAHQALYHPPNVPKAISAPRVGC